MPKQLARSIQGQVSIRDSAADLHYSVGDDNPMPVAAGAYPAGATAVTAASGNVAAAVAAASLPAAAAKTNYITGFEVTGSGATAGSVVTVTVTGTISGTLSYTVVAVAGALLGNAPLIVQFPVAIPASAVNTAITVSVPSLGLGNTNSTVVAHGYVV